MQARFSQKIRTSSRIDAQHKEKILLPQRISGLSAPKQANLAIKTQERVRQAGKYQTAFPFSDRSTSVTGQGEVQAHMKTSPSDSILYFNIFTSPFLPISSSHLPFDLLFFIISLMSDSPPEFASITNLFYSGQFQEGRSQLDRLIHRSPDNSILLANRALFSSQLGEDLLAI